MTTLEDVQASLIILLKSSSAILARLSDPKEIREIEWRGAKFSYPNIRVRVNEFQRKDADCDIFNVSASVLVFGETASSLTINSIASEIFNFLDRKNIRSAMVNTVTRIRAKQFGAEFVEESSAWRSEILLQFQVS